MDNIMLSPDPLASLQILYGAQVALPEALGLAFKVPAGLDDNSPKVLTMAWQGHRWEYSVHTQRIHRASDLGQLRARLAHPEQVLLLTPYLTADLGRKCLELGLQFLDMAGNLNLAAPGLRLFVVGNRLTANPEGLYPRGPVRSFKAYNRKGLQVVFALLAGECMVGEAYRELSRVAGVATGTVGLVMKGLMEAGLLVLTPTGRALVQPENLEEGWVANYPYRLRPHLHPTRFRASERGGWRGLDLAPFGAQWGGEVAGDRLTANLQPMTATIYTPGNPAKLAATLRLRPDPQGDIEILDRFWDFPNPQDYPQDLVPPLLVYADLAASGDPRNADIARMIHAHHLHPK